MQPTRDAACGSQRNTAPTFLRSRVVSRATGVPSQHGREDSRAYVTADPGEAVGCPSEATPLVLVTHLIGGLAEGRYSGQKARRPRPGAGR